jgi:ribosomal protein S18 acetylase RimI-like enzyme
MTSTPILFDDFRGTSAPKPEIGALKLVRVDAPGARLDAAYDLLTRVFDLAVIDTKETYVNLLSPDRLCLDGFSAICVAAYFEHDRHELLAGFLSSNLMWIDRSTGFVQLAIGNIATSPALRDIGLRGVGNALWHAAIAFGESEATTQQGVLAYSVAEAEPESLGFWKKLGYLYPHGVDYWQPPLEFRENGEKVRDEVKETLLIRPLTGQSHDSVDAHVLRQMILAIYRNWCIETNRPRLSKVALDNAERYVMKKVFTEVNKTIPQNGKIRLVDFMRV